MPVQFDNVYLSPEIVTSPSTITNYVVSSQRDRYLLVAVCCYDADPSLQVNGITYDGVALARVFREPGSNDVLDVWGLVAPHSGSHDLVLTMDRGSIVSVTVGIRSYWGVDQGVPVASIQRSSVAVAGYTFVMPSTRLGQLIVDQWAGEDTGGTTAVNDATQTQRFVVLTGQQPGGGSDKPAAYPTTSIGWKTGDYEGYGAVVLNPADPVRWQVA